MMSSHSFDDTSDPNLKRVVDQYGNWTHYFLVKEKVYVPAVNHILGLGFNKGPRFYAYLLTVTAEEAKKKLEAAGDEGTRTHRAIRDLIDGMKVSMTTKYPSDLSYGRQEVLNPEEWENIIAFMAFCKKYNPKVVSNDFATYSVRHGYAGSPDALLIVTVPFNDNFFPKSAWGKDVLFLPDWKSSGAVYLEYGLQVAAYLEGVKERGTFKNTFAAYEHRIYTGIVRVGTRHKNGGYEVIVWSEKETQSNFKKFLSTYDLFRMHEPEDKVEVVDIPMQFFIKLKRVTEKSVKAQQPSSKATKKGSKKVKGK